MMRLFVGNFDFEHRLACGEGSLPRRLEAINADLAPAWLAVAEDGDAIWMPEGDAAGRLRGWARHGLPEVTAVADPRTLPGFCEAVFWGENDWARTSAQRWGLRWHGCDPAIVRRVNSRRFKIELERRLGLDLPGSEVVATVEELAEAVGGLDRGLGWVLKGEFGGAGREVRFGRGTLSEADAAWAGNRFRRRLCVTIEPRLESIEEAGLQFEIGTHRRTRFLGVTPLTSRPNGGYLGSRYDDDPALTVAWSEAIDAGLRIAAAVAGAGYFGPLGIDAMRYRTTDGATRVRCLQDLNARFTMGRLALGLRRFTEALPTTDGVFRPATMDALLEPRPSLSLHGG